MTKASSAQKKYVAGTSRGTRRAATLLAQMADLERGERIKELRLERHLTQPAVADMVGVTLRAYQEWEAGGGIQWDNAKRLAHVLDVDPAYVMRGEKTFTPDLSVKQLDRIEQTLTGLAQRIERLEQPKPSEPLQHQTAEEVLDEIKTATRALETLLGRIGENVGRRDSQSRRAKDRSEALPPAAA